MKISSKEEWQDLVSKMQASGLTKAEFFRRNNIGSGRFYELAKRYGDGSIPTASGTKRQYKTATPQPKFVELSFDKSKIEKHNGISRILRITTSYGSVLEIPL